MRKKVFSVLLCAAMATSMLAGCGDNSEPASNGGTTDDANANNDAAGGSDDADAGDAAGGSDDAAGGGAAGKKFALVTKSAGNPYNEKEAEGFEDVINSLGGECIIKHPVAATADAQVSEIQSLISQGVDSICVAANDENALQAALEDAMAAGIKVSCLDSKTNAASRMTFANQAGTTEIGQALMDAVYDIAGG